MKSKLLEATLSYYRAQRDEAIAILEVYLTKPVGIGEHSNLLAEITKWTATLTEAEENLETINRHFSENKKL